MNTQARQQGTRWTWQFAVVVGLLIGFGALVVVMLFAIGGSDIAWQRRVYLFGAVEAIVFTAVGWLFGREVHRAEAESARTDASEAKQDAASSREEAKNRAQDAAKAERMAAEEQAKGRAVQAAVHSVVSDGARPAEEPRDVGYEEEPAKRAGTVIDLKALVDQLYRPDANG